MINIFEESVINSGFKRDMNEFHRIIQAQHNRQNLALFKDTSRSMLESLNNIYDSDLPDVLDILLPSGNVKPFTQIDYIKPVKQLLDNPNINVDQFFSALTQVLSQIVGQINQNETTLNSIRTTILPYCKKDYDQLSENNRALISLLFKDSESRHDLKSFAKALTKWNRALRNYHTLLSPKSPENIELVQIQSGSLDVIVNFDINVAVNLVDLAKVGFEVFLSYLAYKNALKPFLNSLLLDPEVQKLEANKEAILLGSIGRIIREKIAEQFNNARSADKNISSESSDVKINDMAEALTDHIVRGNDIKLLNPPEDSEDSEAVNNTTQLRKISADVRKNLAKLPEEEKTKLLEHYKKDEKEEEIPIPKGKKK